VDDMILDGEGENSQDSDLTADLRIETGPGSLGWIFDGCSVFLDRPKASALKEV
jgi:hypothetical protein